MASDAQDQEKSDQGDHAPTASASDPSRTRRVGVRRQTSPWLSVDGGDLGQTLDIKASGEQGQGIDAPGEGAQEGIEPGDPDVDSNDRVRRHVDKRIHKTIRYRAA